MKVLLYRRGLDLASGAGQLMLMQAHGLKALGIDAQLACHHGAAKFFLRTGWLPRRVSPIQLRRLTGRADRIVVDHGMEIPDADLLFVHNLAAEANLHLQRDDLADRAADEARFFRELNVATPIVASSQLVKAALTRHFALAAERIVVHYPGFRSDKFQPQRAALLRGRARRALKLDGETPLVGFVTSGDFQKRGLDLFLASAQAIAQRAPDVSFLVVGSKSLPDWTQQHPLVASGKVHYRPKNTRPELWLAALDVFLYAARFEEFGMVILEAQASGVPVLTSRRVGAAECLPQAYAPWLLDTPDANRFAGLALALLADAQARDELVAAGLKSVSAFDHREYARATIATIRKSKAVA
ncbi:MAG TPA: glycosyltransferase family 4 protein [Gammaproteobacteria bacterium]|nr:glycosyltransferase family 4 protein [Gammaproteobacteria bacterium]